MQRLIAVEWPGGISTGEVRVSGGSLVKLGVNGGEDHVDTADRATRFHGKEGHPLRINLTIDGASGRYQTNPTIVSLITKNSFSFLLRDVDSRFPIWIPEFEVIVTEGDDSRTAREIINSVRSAGGKTRLQTFMSEPEESFDSAAAEVRSMSCHTWLGVSRNMRLFAIGEKLEWIEPRFHYFPALIPESNHHPFRYEFVMGRGWGSLDNLERSLEERVLPILNGRLRDADIEYRLKAFATLQSAPLSSGQLAGTDYLLADGHAKQHMFTDSQQERFESLMPAEMEHGEETVLCLQISAANRVSCPRYAFLRTVWPSEGPGEGSALNWEFEPESGFGTYKSGRIFAISKLNGLRLEQPEVAILLQPGETVTLDILLPHRPISRDMAIRLSEKSASQLLADCRSFWQKKLDASAKIALPEKRIAELIQAGLLHLDLICYGQEPDGALAATIGDYPPLGSESSPIIQFFDSMGCHEIARRCIQYFFEKQHDDGFMQNFNNYMIETGAVLWTVGEHHRYTRDKEWVRELAPKIRKSCEFLTEWRRRNQKELLRGKGFGMLEGKTADPEDPFRSFMLNGYAYLGFSRIAEAFKASGLPDASTWEAEAIGLRRDIRQAFFESLASSPVIPLGDGRWTPTCPPWVESRGALALHIDGGDWHTHGSMVARDSLLGPLYLAYQEVLDPNEPAMSFLLDFHSELMTERNVAFSQPYYSRHPWIHLKRHETKEFLKAYYNTMASLCDRETYTFWEHYFRASAHKTHEEAWFLMETRSMLYMEEDTTLLLLRGIPRAYLRDGQSIELKGVRSYFGPLSLSACSRIGQGRIQAHVLCDSNRRPEKVEIRLPHPDGAKAISVDGGAYDPETETVLIERFAGEARVELMFKK